MASSTEVRTCSVARTLEVIGDKWSLLAVRELMLGNPRFDEIVRRTGAPRDILTTRLRKLEAHDIITRVQYQDRPPRSEYRLTELGWSLLPIVTMLRDWGDHHLAGRDGPPMNCTHSCGEPFDPTVVCGHCGEPLDRDDLHMHS